MNNLNDVMLGLLKNDYYKFWNQTAMVPAVNKELLKEKKISFAEEQELRVDRQSVTWEPAALVNSLEGTYFKGAGGFSKFFNSMEYVHLMEQIKVGLVKEPC